MEIKFEKWEGLGNDFIIVDSINLTKELIIKLCDRNFGIGADGIFIPTETKETDIAWKFYNADGTSAQMCGNGMRCFAKYVHDKKLVDKQKFGVKTLAGIIVPEILENGDVRVNMGKPFLDADKIPVNCKNPQGFIVTGFEATAVGMGNPHCVIFSKGNTKKQAVEYGKTIEHAAIFPEKTNVEFVKIISPEEINVDVWERGCGITLACGTGACASVVAGVIKKLLTNKVKVNLPGGALYIEYNGGNVYMTGSANKVFEGKINI